MVKVDTYKGYDIYSLSKEECKNRFYVYPTYAVFVEGENYDTVGVEETSEPNLDEARKWCDKYSRK